VSRFRAQKARPNPTPENPVKAWKLLVLVPAVAALAMVPQDPSPAPADAPEPSTTASITELQYVNLQGTTQVVTARQVVEIRFLEDHPHHIRLELVYENGDYSLIDAQAFHLLRSGPSAREVRLVRGKQARMRFPRLL
jgi:hypothetical protein